MAICVKTGALLLYYSSESFFTCLCSSFTFPSQGQRWGGGEGGVGAFSEQDSRKESIFKDDLNGAFHQANLKSRNSGLISN